LKEGLDAVEERARSELGMIKRDEMFFQVLDGQRGATPAGR
jgi:cell division protein FtsB